MPRKQTFGSEALQFAFDRYVSDDPARVASYEEELSNAEVARKIFDLRAKAGLTQRQLAKLVGTTASAIAQIEDADYQGQSLTMLRRIAAALNQRIEVRFVPVKRTAKMA